MSKIMILTDSSCDLSPEQVEELGITVLPFEMNLCGKTFREMFDVTKEEFFAMMDTTDEIPKHSQISPLTFAETYKSLYDKGYTDIISVSINSEGSGTYNNSIIAKNDFFEENPDAVGKVNIYNIDSKAYSIFYGYPILEAAKKIRKGASAEDIVAYFEDWFRVCAIYSVPYTLKYVKKSGRVSAAAAFAGELLGIKPIVRFADNKADIIGKIRGEKNIVSKLCDIAEENMTPQTPYIMLYGRETALPLAKEVEKEMIKRVGRKAELFNGIGPAVASNIGGDVIGIIVRRKNIDGDSK